MLVINLTKTKKVKDEELNLIINEGKIVHASFVEVQIQRNRREENKQIKQGEIPQQWKSNPNKVCPIVKKQKK